MRLFVLALVLLPLLSVAQTPADECALVITGLGGLRESPVQLQRRAELIKKCSPIFSDKWFRTACQRNLPQIGAGGWAPVMLGLSRGEGPVKSYCESTQSLDLTACTMDENAFADLPDAERNRQWRVLLGRILELDLGKKAGHELAARFGDSWDTVFPTVPPVPEQAPGLTIEAASPQEARAIADRLLALRPQLQKCFAPQRPRLRLSLGLKEPQVDTPREDTDWKKRACASELLKKENFPPSKRGFVAVSWDLAK